MKRVKNSIETASLLVVFRAVSQGDLGRAVQLIQQGSNVNTRNEHGISLLFIAAREGRARIVNGLLTKGAEVDYVGANGVTALVMATRTSCTVMVI